MDPTQDSTGGRETLGSRIGFILLSAGCAIGIGNVWKFPWMAGQHGGGLFVLMYLAFLLLLGVPVLTMEYAAGRASRRSIILLHSTLTPDRRRRAWRLHGWIGFAANWLLMMFYTIVAGWMALYFIKTASGTFTGCDAPGVARIFSECLADPLQQMAGMICVSVSGFAVCACGLRAGLERVTKFLMLALLALMAVLAANSLMLPGGGEGLKFYLKPDFAAIRGAGLLHSAVAAMNQAFFTLGLGIGSMSIFGSYIGRNRTLLGEAFNVTALDTFVAILAGLVIFPACSAFGVRPDSGPGLVFVTLPNVFNSMPLGRVWGATFFVFMFTAAMSTVLAIFENIIACTMDMTGWTRRRSALVCGIAMPVLSAPCALGFNLLSGIHPLGGESTILDLEDFLVSDLALPLGSLAFAVYCTRRIGWGWKPFLEETNAGRGIRLSSRLHFLFAWVVPAAITVVMVAGLHARLAAQ